MIVIFSAISFSFENKPLGTALICDDPDDDDDDEAAEADADGLPREPGFLVALVAVVLCCSKLQQRE